MPLTSAERCELELEAPVRPELAPMPPPAGETVKRQKGPTTRAAKKRARRKDARIKRRARNARRDAAAAARLSKELARLEVQAAELGISTPSDNPARRPLRIVPAWVQSMVLAIQKDDSGRAARAALRRISLKLIAADARAAALCGGRFTWADARARRIVAAAFLLDAMKVRNDEPNGRNRDGRWFYKVNGVPVDFLRWLHRNPATPIRPGEYRSIRSPGSERPYRRARGVPSRTALTGMWRGGRWDHAECGAYTALRQLGHVYSLHNGATPKTYETVSGYQPVTFYLCVEAPELGALPELERVEREIVLEGTEADTDARAPPLGW